jgi:hypothetical protein
MAVNTDECDVPGEKAFSHGTFTLKLTHNKGGDKGTKIGNFQPILEKQFDNSW